MIPLMWIYLLYILYNTIPWLYCIVFDSIKSNIAVNSYFFCETEIKLLLWNCSHFTTVHLNAYARLGREICWHTSPTKIFFSPAATAWHIEGCVERGIGWSTLPRLGYVKLRKQKIWVGAALTTQLFVNLLMRKTESSSKLKTWWRARYLWMISSSAHSLFCWTSSSLWPFSWMARCSSLIRLCKRTTPTYHSLACLLTTVSLFVCIKCPSGWVTLVWTLLTLVAKPVLAKL